MTQLELSITQIRQTMKDMTTIKVDCISDQALTQLKNLLRDGQDTLNEFAQDRILRGIKAGFEDMSYRYQEIVSPFQDTFEWVLNLNGESVEATKFTQWLSSGDGIFHICGKLGSGKSTLSKWQSALVTGISFCFSEPFSVPLFLPGRHGNDWERLPILETNVY